jgi:hypothetical protein
MYFNDVYAAAAVGAGTNVTTGPGTLVQTGDKLGAQIT